MFVAELASGRPTARWSELDALRYVVHLVGDIHQPMHTVSDADLGGNCERLREPIDQARNLHALWDGALVDALNPNAAALTAALERYIAALGAGEAAALARGRVEDWVWESHEIAVRNVYGKLHIPVEPVEFPTSCREAPLAMTEFHAQIDSLYIDMMKPVVRDQLVKGGLRLARVLKEALRGARSSLARTRRCGGPRGSGAFAADRDGSGGQNHFKAGTFAELAVDADLAAMRAHNGGHGTQTEAEAFFRVGVRHPVEAIEDMRQVIGRDTDAGVLNGQMHLGSVFAHLDAHPAA